MAETVLSPTGENRFAFLLDRDRFVGAIFLIPALVYIVALVGVPFLLAILFSVTSVSVGDTSADFVGLTNFANVIGVPTFQRALLNTFVFTIVSQIIIIVLANILALILAQDFRGKWFVRLLVILPWATPVALGTIGWLLVLDTKLSPIDWVLREVGILGPGTILGPDNNINWLSKPRLAQASVILVQVWRLLPLSAVILMAGLSSIPGEIIDQAEVDGSSFLRTLFQVKLPMILPIMIISLLFSTVFAFSDMTVVFTLTRGGPIDHTQVLATWSYFVGIEGGNLAQGAAISLFLFPVLLAVAVVMLRVASRTEVR